MTVAGKYIQLQEGKISKKQFLESVRKDRNLMGIVTNLQSFGDTVRVLKNRRLISENLDHSIGEIFEEIKTILNSMDSYDSMEIDLLLGDAAKKYDLTPNEIRELDHLIFNYGKESGEHYDYEDNLEEITDDYDDEDFLDYDNNRSNLDNSDADQQIDSDLNIPKDSKYDQYTDQLQQALRDKGLDDNDIISIFETYPKLIKMAYQNNDSPENFIHTLYKLSTDHNHLMSLNEVFDHLKLDRENLNPDSFACGWKYEYKNQKTKDLDKAKTLAEKNLLKDSLYYIKLINDIKIKTKKRTDLPTEVDKKMSNTVDKANQNKVETPNDKASANKASKEKQIIPKYKEDTFKAQRAKGIKGVMDMPGKEKKIKLSEVQSMAKIMANAIKNIKL